MVDIAESEAGQGQHRKKVCLKGEAEMSKETEANVQVAPEAIRAVTAIIKQVISGQTEELMARMEHLEEAMSQQQQSGDRDRTLDSSGDSQASQFGHRVGVIHQGMAPCMSPLKSC